MYCNDLSFLKTAGICNRRTRLITVVYRPAGKAENYHDASRCCPTPEDPEINAQSWRPSCRCLRELESAFCCLRCLLINLDAFQLREGPHLVQFLLSEMESWLDCHSFLWKHRLRSDSLSWTGFEWKHCSWVFLTLLTRYTGNISISRITYSEHFQPAFT